MRKTFFLTFSISLVKRKCFYKNLAQKEEEGNLKLLPNTNTVFCVTLTRVSECVCKTFVVLPKTEVGACVLYFFSVIAFSSTHLLHQCEMIVIKKYNGILWLPSNYYIFFSLVQWSPSFSNLMIK